VNLLRAACAYTQNCHSEQHFYIEANVIAQFFSFRSLSIVFALRCGHFGAGAWSAFTLTTLKPSERFTT